jgi:Cytochrome c7 and related cytochrome c
MPQIFHPSMNTLSRATIFGAVFALALAAWLLGAIVRSPYATSAGVIKEQPVPFSHKHHVADIGIDCRYCHTSVEKTAFAGIPPTQTCMNCHSFVWADAPMLAPVRDSFRDDKPLVWNRVNDLPGYVYFDHSIHVNKGVACTTCHGDVGDMPLVYREASLLMEWCLECHWEPERFVGPKSLVFSPSTRRLDAPQVAEADLLQAYHIQSKTNCSICHR